MKRIAIKIGSNLLTRQNGTLDITQMSDLIDQIAELHKSGKEIILISSGAVASGRNEIKIKQKKIDSVSARQLYSSIGQAKLINRYYDLFRHHSIICGQILTTKENFSSRLHYLTQKHCMEVMLEHKVIPIVNENDTISITGLMFTDNDELSSLIVTMMKMDVLIILTDVDGIYNGNPKSSNASVIREVESEKDISFDIQAISSSSSYGRGGMKTKYFIAKKVANEGIMVMIANGRRKNILLDLLNNTVEKVIHTRFPPSEKPINSIKSWIAHSEDFAKGEIYINSGVEKALKKLKAVSILLVGVTRIVGNFKKDDIVRILNEKKLQIGIGKSNYDSREAALYLGKHDMKPMIHYDYLYLE